MTRYIKNNQKDYLSNFYKIKILDQKYSHTEYPSVEHFFYSMKYFINKSNNWLQHIENINKIKNPKDIKLYTQAYPHNCSFFCQKKDEIMKYGLYLKFSSNDNLKEKLKKEKKIVAKINDEYWGVNNKGKGQNKLGELLEEIKNLI
jgi:ribA/ribD-fused uncharacterized protein